MPAASTGCFSSCLDSRELLPHSLIGGVNISGGIKTLAPEESSAVQEVGGRSVYTGKTSPQSSYSPDTILYAEDFGNFQIFFKKHFFRRFSSGPPVYWSFFYFFFIFLLKNLVLEKTKPYNIVGENPLYKFR